MIVVMGHIEVPAAAMAGLGPALERQVRESRQEDGCIDYTLAPDPLVPGRIVVAERWRDLAALAAHGEAPHMGAWRAALAATGGASRQITRYRVTDATDL